MAWHVLLCVITASSTPRNLKYFTSILHFICLFDIIIYISYIIHGNYNDNKHSTYCLEIRDVEVEFRVKIGYANIVNC